jgi:uncharacterized protein
MSLLLTKGSQAMHVIDRQSAAMLAAAVLAGFFFDWLGFPIAWMLGPMATGIAFAIAGGRPKPLPRQLQAGALTMLGISVGLSFPPALLRVFGTALPWVLGAILITGALSMLNGFLLSRWGGVDPASGFLGSVPGAASGMVAMSAEVGADARLVAVFQYLRLLTVAFLSPWLIEALFPAAPGAAPGAGALGVAGAAGEAAAGAGTLLPPPFGLPAVVLAALAGLWVAHRLAIPSGTFLGPMAAVLLVTWTDLATATFPAFLLKGALLLLGAWVGAQFDWPTVRRLGRAALVEFLLVIALILASAAIGYGLARATGIDARTAVLGAMPGAMEVQIALAFSLGANAPLVVAMHTIRILILVLIGPWVALRLTRSRVPLRT